VSSRHPRIQVPVDPELQTAIARARQRIGSEAPTSQVVRALALRGAEALATDDEGERRAREFAISVADGRSGLDLARLRTVRDRAWR
jgi:hypothetical protein